MSPSTSTRQTLGIHVLARNRGRIRYWIVAIARIHRTLSNQWMLKRLKWWNSKYIQKINNWKKSLNKIYMKIAKLRVASRRKGLILIFNGGIDFLGANLPSTESIQKVNNSTLCFLTSWLTKVASNLNFFGRNRFLKGRFNRNATKKVQRIKKLFDYTPTVWTQPSTRQWAISQNLKVE